MKIQAYFTRFQMSEWKGRDVELMKPIINKQDIHKAYSCCRRMWMRPRTHCSHWLDYGCVCNLNEVVYAAHVCDYKFCLRNNCFHSDFVVNYCWAAYFLSPDQSICLRSHTPHCTHHMCQRQFTVTFQCKHVKDNEQNRAAHFENKKKKSLWCSHGQFWGNYLADCTSVFVGSL